MYLSIKVYGQYDPKVLSVNEIVETNKYIESRKRVDQLKPRDNFLYNGAWYMIEAITPKITKGDFIVICKGLFPQYANGLDFTVSQNLKYVICRYINKESKFCNLNLAEWNDGIFKKM